MDDHHESPSLVVGRLTEGATAPLAYELKFLVPAATGRAVEEWASAEAGLTRDRHGDPSRSGRYTTTTLYLDTRELDVYHRREGYGRRRYRLRRYGDGAQVHLECKTKKGDRVSKERTVVGLDQLSHLDRVDEHAWTGNWFQRRVAELRLAPASLVTYHRAAFVGACAEGPLRVTVDWEARSRLCSATDNWLPTRLEPTEGVCVLGGRAVVELKFLSALPLPFKDLMRKLTLEPGGVSKYRLGRDAIGLPPGCAQAADRQS